MAKDSGIAYVGCRNSNHFGPAAPYVLKGCFQDVLTIVGTNAFPSMAPWGGKDVLVGNNPLGIGIPRRCAPHFILDISMSVVSRGKIRARAEKGERIPLGWALDSKGKATDDPRKALEGYVLPIGGHKGYGLALAIDVIAGVLTGSGFGSGIRSLYQQMEEPQHIGHFFICINPTFLMEREEYHMRVERLFQEIKSSTPIDEQLPVLLPGELEGRYYQERSRLGIPYEEDAYAVLQDLARGKYNYRIPKM